MVDISVAGVVIPMFSTWLHVTIPNICWPGPRKSSTRKKKPVPRTVDETVILKTDFFPSNNILFMSLTGTEFFLNIRLKNEAIKN